MKLNERLTRLSEMLVNLPANPLARLAENAGAILPCDFLAVCLLTPDGNGYRVQALLGDLAALLPARVFGAHEGLPGLVIRTGRTILCDDISQHPQISDDLEGFGIRLNLLSALVLPLRYKDQVLGALYFGAQPPVAYDLDDMQIGSLLAAGLSICLESARLYQSAAAERRLLAGVLSSGRDAAVVIGPTGVVLLANPALGKMLQTDAAAMVGQPYAHVITHAGLQQLLAGGNGEAMVEITLPGGRLVRASRIEVSAPSGEKVGRAAILRDMTPRSELERMKSEFVQTVSHDLKNPISSVVLATELLLRSGDLNELQQEMAQRVLDTAYYMDSLVSDLLDLGQIEARLGLKRAPLDLAVLARAVLADLYPQAAEKQIELTLEAADQVMVTGDRQRLRQVLMNLIGNAIKYTPVSGAVTVSIALEAGDVTVRVQDNGIGIPADSLPFVFDKFYRVKNAATAGINGTGLGLAIARSVIEAHQGRIWVDSEEGAGSAFAFSVPRET